MLIQYKKLCKSLVNIKIFGREGPFMKRIFSFIVDCNKLLVGLFFSCCLTFILRAEVPMSPKLKPQSQRLSKKLYILDTNVLLHDPRAMFSFEGVQVGIPIMVLEELENFKRESSGRGKNARETVRYLDQLRSQGSLHDGVKIENGGSVMILFTPENIPKNFILNTDIVDNEILLTAVAYRDQGYDVRFISKDLNARVKADVLGLAAEDYLKGYVPQDEFYKGWVKAGVTAAQLKTEFPTVLKELSHDTELTLNEYVLVENQHNSNIYRLFRYIGGHKQFFEVAAPAMSWPIEAKNPQQLMALDALFDPTIEFVSLLGPAGTGKTFLALLAGLYAVMMQHDIYQRLLVSRPVIPLGPDIGYLPGDISEKLHMWMQPIYDNIEVIIHLISVSQHIQNVRNAHEVEHFEPEEPHDHHNHNGHDAFGKKKHKKNYQGQHKHQFNGKKRMNSVDDLIHQGKLSLEAITYMRGRSIPYQYILIDEVQNLSPHEVKTLISRVGQGSKIVLCGDPYQIDSPYLDFSSNGLVIASDKFKGQSLFATVFLESSERSELSRLAAELL